ncbi:K+/H+ antiporter YhaU regulatory subunit KhtT [Evansella vedderi]|uniref:K+/H+ antiporter YhaU regulatory subunit KhtT n=1 Tax=Evansella vedderi TaxID=38282 RepID=A0ABT9ZUZ2_9BACI|nr:hypothetical protein [Evansella vedderi]MDQ0254547.1 K+/H+ antiporter YhaU regulatory subunit KhtT [Evansella vedderi]
MDEKELIKVILHRLAKIEQEMMKRKDLVDIMEQLVIHEESLENIHDALGNLKSSVEIKHMENINADEILLRSIREY